MRQLTWQDYYDGFYDWAESTQVSYLSRLSDYGSPEQVAEIAVELMDTKVASRLVDNAINAGVRFNPCNIVDIRDAVDEACLERAAASVKGKFSQEQLSELDGVLDEDILIRLARAGGLRLYQDDDTLDEPVPLIHEERQPKIGFFGKLLIAWGMASDDKHKENAHGREQSAFDIMVNGKEQPRTCTGDCANCPPHYGYRYGRWYYGKHHQYGCEFGGNKGL